MEEVKNNYHELVKTESNVPHPHILQTLFEKHVANSPNHKRICLIYSPNDFK